MPDAFVSRISAPAQVEPSSPPSTDPTIMTQQPLEAEPPLEVWAEVNGMPYTAKHFGINIWNEHTNASVKSVEGYILNEITKKGLDPTIESYNEIMGNIDQFLGLSRNIAANIKFERVADYVKLFTKYAKIEKAKRKILEQANQLREIEYG